MLKSDVTGKLVYMSCRINNLIVYKMPNVVAIVQHVVKQPSIFWLSARIL